MFLLNFNRLLQTKFFFAAILAVGLLCGNSPAALAYQTGDPTMTGYPTTGGTTTTEDPTQTGYTSPPHAVDDFLMMSYDSAIVFNPLENDMQGTAPINPSSFTIELGPDHGTVDIIDPLTAYVEYTPDPGYAGMDSFLYTVSDANGNVSNIAMVSIDVINNPPQLLTFTVAESSAHVWHFEGQVSDEDPASCTVTFGGLLAGETAEVNADGSFSFSKILPDGVNGTVSAQAEDELGEVSNTLYGEVYHF